MTHPIQHAIETRVSVNRFDPGRPLADEVVASLVRQATRAPSAYNLQNWRFIAVRSEGGKARLQPVAHGQQQVVDASVVFIVCGILDAHDELAAVLAPCVHAGLMAQRTADAWVAQAQASHESDPVLRRDEAVRSASLAAMTMMLAAQGMGLGSCAMSGFDPAGVARAFELGAAEIPVLLVAVGHRAAGSWSQKPRKPVGEVLEVC